MRSIITGPSAKDLLYEGLDARSELSKIIEKNLSGKYIEILPDGSINESGVQDLQRKFHGISAQLESRNLPLDTTLVICTNSAIDFIPAAWVALLNGYNLYPWQIQRTNVNTRNYEDRTELLRRCLANPVLITTDSERTDFSKTAQSKYRDVICIDKIPAYTRTSRLDIPPRQSSRSAKIYLPTSGTTSKSKIAVLTHKAYGESKVALGLEYSESTALSMLPFDNMSGMQIILPNFKTQILLHPESQSARPLELLRTIQTYNVNRFGLSTSLASRILSDLQNEPNHYDLSSVETIGFGLEKIAPAVVQKFVQYFRNNGAENITFSFGYGMTEAGLLCRSKIYNAKQGLDEISKIDTISFNQCLPGKAVRIVDENGRLSPPGRKAQIQALTEIGALEGYLLENGSIEPLNRSDGWFDTGDLGYIDNGELTITGRQRGVFITKGKNIRLEDIEITLKGIADIRENRVSVEVVPPADGHNEALVVFFSLEDDFKNTPHEIAQTIRRLIASSFGIQPHAVVHLTEDQFPLTTTSKLHHAALVEGFLAGRYEPLDEFNARKQSFGDNCTDQRVQDICHLWQHIMKLPKLPSPNDNFYDLGGDSLQAATLITEAEKTYESRLDVQEFFNNPTPKNLLSAFSTTASKEAENSGTEENLLYRISEFVGSWRGKPTFDGSLLRGCNIQGERPPLFWVFQSEPEFLNLAEALGRDQPLYGMRSAVKISKNYNAQLLEQIGNRYLWELLAICPTGKLAIGGNCQGAIIALAMARLLRNIGRNPQPLILMEWSYSYGRYQGPTALVYGEKSYTAKIYRDQDSTVNWRGDFPQATVRSIPGAHGHFFENENVNLLAEQLKFILNE